MDYAVFHIFASPGREDRREIAELMGTDQFGQHAGNLETSLIMSMHPETVKMDAVEKEGLVNYGQLNHLKDAFTSIWWYADHPTHAAGDPFSASARAGEKAVELTVKKVARIVRTIKEDESVLRLQEEFYKKAGDKIDLRSEII